MFAVGGSNIIQQVIDDPGDPFLLRINSTARI